MKFTWLASLLVLAIIGCEGANSPNVVARNKVMLSSKGDLVGVLPDGRTVVRYQIDRGDAEHDHYIYVVGDSNSTTDNHVQNHGKNSTHNHVEAVIE